jgi:CheY-like chemotaxis protein
MIATQEYSAPVDVLIAEDDDLLRGSYRLLLESRGLACAEAATGTEAIEMARSRQPRCVLLDLCLPAMDGFSVARALRADPRTSAAHIHCVTGLTDDRSREQASRSGFELFLTKPVDPATLLEAVQPPPPHAEVSTLSCSSLREAEDLLDWLENHGCHDLGVSLMASAITVRCICPPGVRLVRDNASQVRLEMV